jgi:hypothetical protein
MTVTISRLYDDYQAAERAVRDLEAAGLAHSEISVVASNADNWYSGDKTGTKRVDRDADGVDDRAEGAGKGAGVGAAIGGTAGLLAGLGLLAIPGVGPVVAAGWLVATAAGVARSRQRGIVGALTPERERDDAHVCAEGVDAAGRWSVRVSMPRARVEALLGRSATSHPRRYRKAVEDSIRRRGLYRRSVRKERDL